MKLLNKTSLIIITISLFIFLGGGVAFFYSIKALVKEETDSELLAYSANLYQELQLFQAYKNAIFITENNVILKEVEVIKLPHPYFSDTLMFDPLQQISLPYRVYNFAADYGTKKYEIKVLRATNNTEKLLERIVLALTSMLIVLILLLAVFNRFVFKQIWDDFFSTLNKIKSFQLQSNQDLKLEESEIEEFQELNREITRMTDRINRDYHNLKEFTENVSHELQTPLAIMRSKIELMLQSENIPEDKIGTISSLYESVNRLSNMNKVLILLTRIENNQFPETQKINIAEKVKLHLEMLQAMLEDQNINLKVDIEDNYFTMNDGLADILLMNLLKNAIRHNEKNGQLNIILKEKSLIIQNSGAKPQKSEQNLFNRFEKSSKSSESLGLGLAIVKKITDLYSIDIQYSYRESLHEMRLDF